MRIHAFRASRPLGRSLSAGVAAVCFVANASAITVLPSVRVGSQPRPDTLSFGEGTLSLPGVSGMSVTGAAGTDALSMGEGTLGLPRAAALQAVVVASSDLLGTSTAPASLLAAQPVPEPASAALLAAGAAALAWLRQRRQGRRG